MPEQKGKGMKKYLFIASGSFAGAALRYIFRNVYFYQNGNIPYATLCINIIGAFLLAFTMTVVFETVYHDTDIHQGVTIGLLGAFTTFSTFCKEVSVLIAQGSYFQAGIYLIASVVLGLISAHLGAIAAQNLKCAHMQRREKEPD